MVSERESAVACYTHTRRVYRDSERFVSVAIEPNEKSRTRYGTTNTETPVSQSPVLRRLLRPAASAKYEVYLEVRYGFLSYILYYYT